MGRIRDFFARRSVEPEPVLHVDEAGKEKANKALYDALGTDYYIDWSLPQSVGLKGDNRFVGDSLTIVPQSKEALEIIYGGLAFNKHGSHTPLGELSNRFTNEIDQLGRVFIEIARRSSD